MLNLPYPPVMGEEARETATSKLPLRNAARAFAGRRWSDVFTYPQLIGILCAVVSALAILATRPVLDMGTSDDWSYARTSLEFLRTGHIIYNGWATAMLGWQIIWGALIFKLFGFSFLALRLSTLPFAMGAAYLLHRICMKLGLTVQNSSLVTLTVVLSPLFLPLAASFMTDIPAFFWLLVGLYACLRATSATTVRATILWLTFATATNVVAGSSRQIIWLVTLIMIPSAAWLQRNKPWALLTAALLWIASVIAISGCMLWFYRQPYSIPEKIVAGRFTVELIPHALQQLRDLFLSVLLLSLPVLSVFLRVLRRVSRPVFLISLAVSLVLLAVRIQTHGVSALAPWMPNIVTEYGIGGSGSWESLGQKAVVLVPWVRAVITGMVLLAACAWIAAWLPRLRFPSFADVNGRRDTASWIVLSTLLFPFSLAYSALLMPRAVFGVALDRYLLPLVALFAIVVLRYFQDHFHDRIPALSYVLLGLFSAYGIASTHDYFSAGRARLTAASSIEAAGIPRTKIQAGWEYDGWTQITTEGYINDPRLVIPKGAYKPVNRLEGLPAACRFDFANLTPAITPQYFVVFSPQSCLRPSRFAPVAFDTWLPPFDRKIYIQQLPFTN